MSNQTTNNINTSNNDVIMQRADPLEIVPNIELKATDVVYAITLFFSTMMVVYAILLHFSTYNSPYYDVIATVTEVDCNRFPVNNHRSEYHCAIGIEYPPYPGSDDVIRNSLTFVDSERFFSGDRIHILVDRYNPLNIEISVIPDQNMAVIICLFGLILAITATGMKFMRIV
jgi:hypothetical protein